MTLRGFPRLRRVTARLLFAGTPDIALPALDALVAGPHEVVGVLTRPDAPAGRGRRTAASAVARRAEELSLPVLRPRSPRDPDALQAVRDLAPDCSPVVAYGALLPADLLAVPPHGWVNLHFSLLPAWRGAAPVQHCLLAGDEMSGATTFRIVEELDAGPVLGTLAEPVRPRDTAGELLDRLSRAGAGLLAATVDGVVEDRLVAVAQPSDQVSYAPRLSPDDARIRWEDPAFAVDRRVRACTPAPGAWTRLDGARLKLGPVEPVDNDSAPAGLGPGELHVTSQLVYAGTGAGAVRLGPVQPAGRRPVPAADWARGARLRPGARLGR